MMKKRTDFVIIILGLMLILAGCQGAVDEKPTEIHYELGERNVMVDDLEIPYFLIDNIEDVPEIPEMKKIDGIEAGDYRKGIFDVEGIGPVNVFIEDINRKMLLIEHDGQYYGITPGTGEEFETFRYNLIVAWELTYK